MYKDLNKRRATTKARVRRYRERQSQTKGVTGVTDLEPKALQVDTQGVTKGVTLAELDADGNLIPEY